MLVYDTGRTRTPRRTTDLVEEITDFVLKQPHEVIPLLLATLRAAAALPLTMLPDEVRKGGGFADIAAGCAVRLRVL
jgi:hypothetical protein